MALRHRVIVVGLGSIGRRHARLLLEREDVILEVCEPSAAALKLAEDLGDLKNHKTFLSAVESQPDIIWLATPTHLHAEQTIKALKACCHVFCEKPMSDSLEDARNMKTAAMSSGRILNIGFMLHFMPAMQRLKELILDGSLGNVVHIHARVGTYITLVNSLSRYQATQFGSLFLDYAHQPDIFYWLIGKIPVEITAVGVKGGSLEFSSDPNSAVVTMRYADDFIATLHLNYIQMPQRHDYEIVGDKGWASLDFETGEIKIGNREDQQITVEKHNYDRDDLYRRQIDAFLKAVRDEAAPETSADDGMVSTAICSAAIESLKTGASVKLGLD